MDDDESEVDDLPNRCFNLSARICSVDAGVVGAGAGFSGLAGVAEGWAFDFVDSVISFCLAHSR